MTTKYEIADLIDKLAQEKTFSLEGVKAIEELRVKSEGQRQRIEALEKELTTARAVLHDYEQKDSAAQITIQKLKEREESLKKREADIFKHEKDAAVANAQTVAFKEAMHIMFKPNTIRESVHRSVPIAREYTGGGNYVEQHQSHEDIVKEEGT